MARALGRQIGQVHVAVGVAGRDDHLHAGHLRAGGIGAVGAARYQADVAARLAARGMPAAYGQQSCVFALAARVGLQAHARIACGFAEPRAQLLVEQAQAFELVGGCEGVQVGELGPGDRNHLAGGVELHGA